MITVTERMILAGNAVSLIAALFTMASAWSRDRKKIYLYQVGQCLLAAAANVLFGSISGTTTFVLCAVRNGLLAYDRFTGRRCAFFVAAAVALGLVSNTKGLVGLIPIVTTVIYTVGCFYVRRTHAIKWNIIVNLALWAIYDFFILDIVAGVVDAVSAATALLSLFRKAPESGEQG